MQLMYNVYCIVLYSVYCIMYTGNSVYCIHYTVYIIQYTLYSIHYYQKPKSLVVWVGET